MTDWLTNATLLQRVKNTHDDSSWDEFNEYYRPYIYMITKGLNIRHHDALEITQMIIIKIWKHLPEFNYDPDKGYFRGWLRTVTVNTVRNYIAKKAYSHESIEGLEEVEEGKGFNNKVTDAEIEAIADREWEHYICDLAWNNVKADFNDNVQEVYAQLSTGTKCETIAENIGIKCNTVYIYRKRIQEKLYKEIRRLNRELG
ncbi:sigma-70 family RNA polymerase sigma factor [Lentisphaera profundi]|uniref:RNA polymerase sigma factor SigS n=1 Tax=Lentisphaera profundi TaxID=1658616 RepID=A0ABY7VMG8_9BACT|nr:sigma-70 family RNA polymerase sigma factor [Lentisphaera profundi]WDE95208.1 sigma-70 family RNA polymerase sigma factor [Lentisphaera profundi]